jgi:predicted DNA-binding protein YlxM (UPF0122 family)
MSKQPQILQLLHGGHLSAREIAAALNISKTSVGDIANATRLADRDWEDWKQKEALSLYR